MTSLFQTAPGFDEPFAVLRHCHDRIRQQINTLNNLLAHLPHHGADTGAQHAAHAILRYFTIAAPMHHEDEEVDMLPMLVKSAEDEDAKYLALWLPKILADHEIMEQLWQQLELQLKDIDAGISSSLSEQDVAQFTSTYKAHMEIEESHIAPIAQRVLNAAQIEQLGNAMQQRRGVE
jgi:pyridoxamine 5'-phosphate oxidase